jgi:hypothetical protein
MVEENLSSKEILKEKKVKERPGERIEDTRKGFLQESLWVTLQKSFNFHVINHGR